MRRFPTRLAAALAAAASLATPAPQANAQSQVPHAWLFGTWTGGLFPAPSGISAQACAAQPIVIFARDVVLRATLTDVTYVQRVIETARTDPGRTEFKFAPSNAGAPASPLLGIGAAPPAVGFGCGDPNVLHVERRSDNEITFPGCSDFPNPLVRCPGR